MSKIYEALNKARREEKQEGPKKGSVETRSGQKIVGQFARRLREVWTNYEALHSSLDKALGGMTGKAILFASSVEEEGTTTVVAEYGTSLGSRREKGILLVDANLRAPALHRLFGIPNETGLTDAILGKGNLKECVVRLGDENLFILPSGVSASSPGSLLSVSRFSRLMKQAKEEFSLILIDGAPIIPYAETPLIASVVDGIVLVVESERTKREIVGRAKTAMEEANARILGVVLNRRRYVIPGFLYRHL